MYTRLPIWEICRLYADPARVKLKLDYIKSTQAELEDLITL